MCLCEVYISACYGVCLSVQGTYIGVLVSVCLCPVAPEMARSHAEYTVVVDSPVLMTCEVAGVPAPEVTWSGVRADLADDAHVLANGALRIDHVTAEHAGMYECVASNVAGNASMAATLNVHGQSACMYSSCKEQK